jgi:hypothetical protein
MVHIPGTGSIAKGLNWITANEADPKKVAGFFGKMVNHIIKVLTGIEVEPEKLSGFARAATIGKRFAGLALATAATGGALYGVGKGLEHLLPGFEKCLHVEETGDDICSFIPSVGTYVTEAGKFITKMPLIPSYATFLSGKAVYESDVAQTGLNILKTCGTSVAGVVSDASTLIESHLNLLLSSRA